MFSSRRPFQVRAIVRMEGEKVMEGLFAATHSTSVRVSRSCHTRNQFFKKTHGGGREIPPAGRLFG